MASYILALRMLSRDARLYLVTWAVVGFSYFGMYILLINLFLLRLGYGPEFIGMLTAAGQLSYVIFSLPAGAMGRRWGNRRIMITGVTLYTVGFSLLPLAEFIPTDLQGVWLVVTYMLAFAGGPLFVVNGKPFLTSATTTQERSLAFSVQAALVPLAAFAGSLTGGLLPGLFSTTLGVSLDQPSPYRYPLLISGALFGICILILSATSETGNEPDQHETSDRQPFPLGLVLSVALIMLLLSPGQESVRNFISYYLDSDLHVNITLIGTIVAVSQLISIPAALLTPLVATRWGYERTFTLGTLGLGCSILLLALVPHWLAAGLGFVGVMTLSSVAMPTFAIFQMEIVSPAHRTAMSAVVMMASGIGLSAIALSGGYIIPASGFDRLFMMGAGLTIVSALLFWFFFRVPRGKFARITASRSEDGYGH